MNIPVDALLLLSVGGPESRADVYPFLEKILKASKSGIPAERIEAVAQRYFARGGKSPANDECRKIILSLKELLRKKGPDIPVYFGNLFSRPLLPDTVREMGRDGIKIALAFATSPFGSEFSCLNYRLAIEAARNSAGDDAPEIRKLRLYFNHPGFICAQSSRLKEALGAAGCAPRDIQLIFTAHSLPSKNPSVVQYVSQIREACSMVAEDCGFQYWDLAFQSRSGPPHQPWLRPTPKELLKKASEDGGKKALVMPIGFLFENMETVYDLDQGLAGSAAEYGISIFRVATAGDHPEIIKMIRELIVERIDGSTRRKFVGSMGAFDDECNGCLCRKPWK